MENLISIHNSLVGHSRDTIRRELMDVINWNDRLICIKGFRGVGKTTFLLDFIRAKYLNDRSCLYANLNNFYFTRRKVFNLADEFYKKGGKILVLDQINKYPDWSKEIRACYDKLPGLQIVFSASPVLRVTEGNELLQDIVKEYFLEGLSFREYLNFVTGSRFRSYSFTELVENHTLIAGEITEKIKPLAYFGDYLKSGYYPYALNNKPFYHEALLRHINLALEIDVTYLNQLELKYLPKLRRLLQVVSAQVPFSPNVSKLSTDVKTSRATIMNYLRYLKNARLINLLFSNGEEDQMKKPDQIFLHNTNLAYAIDPANISNTNLRQTFFYNQVSYKYQVKSSGTADFFIESRYHFSVGGKNKEARNGEDYVAADLIEVGEDRNIPLWLFGFLY